MAKTAENPAIWHVIATKVGEYTTARRCQSDASMLDQVVVIHIADEAVNEALGLAEFTLAP